MNVWVIVTTPFPPFMGNFISTVGTSTTDDYEQIFVGVIVIIEERIIQAIQFLEYERLIRPQSTARNQNAVICQDFCSSLEDRSTSLSLSEIWIM